MSCCCLRVACTGPRRPDHGQPRYGCPAAWDVVHQALSCPCPPPVLFTPPPRRFSQRRVVRTHAALCVRHRLARPPRSSSLALDLRQVAGGWPISTSPRGTVMGRMTACRSRSRRQRKHRHCLRLGLHSSRGFSSSSSRSCRPLRRWAGPRQTSAPGWRLRRRWLMTHHRQPLTMPLPRRWPASRSGRGLVAARWVRHAARCHICRDVADDLLTLGLSPLHFLGRGHRPEAIWP